MSQGHSRNVLVLERQVQGEGDMWLHWTGSDWECTVIECKKFSLRLR